MAQKTHVGFDKKGQLTSGPCKAKKGRCPYGNHFADPNEAHTYLEEVSSALQSLPPELVEGYQVHAEVMGDSKIPFDEAVDMGFPEDIAHLIAGEPTDPKYARENVGKDVEPTEPAVEEKPESVAPEPVEEPKAEPVEEVAEAEPEPVAEVKAETAPEEKPKKTRRKRQEKPEPEAVEPPASLDTPEDVERFQEILSAYKMSSPADFSEGNLPDELKALRGGIFTPAEERDPAPLEAYQKFGKALAAYRVNMLDQLPPEEQEQFGYLVESMAKLDKDADLNGDYSDEEMENKVRSDLNHYGEERNELNDKIVHDLLARKVQGELPEDREEAYNAIDGRVVQIYGGKDRDSETPDVERPFGNAKFAPQEARKLQHHNYINAYSDMLRATREAKAAANAKVPKSVEEIREAVKKRNAGIVHSTPFYDNTAHASTPAELEYYERAAERTKSILKPGACVMMGGMDAEAYQIDHEGGIRTNDGKLWGYVDFESGNMYTADGQNISSAGGARVYANSAELMRYAALDNGSHNEPGITSADPGYKSRYESDPKYTDAFSNVYNHLKQEEALLTERSKRAHEVAKAVNSQDVEDLYERAVAELGMPRSQAYDSNPNPRTLGALKSYTRNYINKKVQAGTLGYDASKGGFYNPNRKPIDAFKPEGDAMYVAGTENLTPTERVSVVNAARRKRELQTGMADQFAGGMDAPPNDYAAVTHRRSDGASRRISGAKDGQILVENVGDMVSATPAYVVVDRDKGLMVPINEGLTPQANLDPRIVGTGSGLSNPVASEYTIQNIINRYKSADPYLPVMQIPTDEENDNAWRPLRRW